MPDVFFSGRGEPRLGVRAPRNLTFQPGGSVAQDVHTTHDRTGDTDRRDTDRRRYNRRTTAGEPSPPYFEAFERIALALEGIQRALTPPPTPPATGGSSGGTRRV